MFCIQETKLKKQNKIKTESSKKFTIYELNRKEKSGGGLCIGVLKDLRPVWVAQGDDEVECISVEIWVDDFPIRVVTAYGPQLGDKLERKQKFWDFIQREAQNAFDQGSGFILQMDSNAHIGKEMLEEDPNPQNLNGKLFCEFMERMPHLNLINALPLCEGSISRMRKTTLGLEQSILDVFVTCHKILPYITKMTIDEKRKHALTNFNSLKTGGKVTESDHNVEILEVSLKFSNMKAERIEVFQFKNRNSQLEFKNLTTNTTDFSSCFSNNLSFEDQARKWKRVLNDYFHKAFKKVRVTNKHKKRESQINDLIERRRKLKSKQVLSEKDEEEVEDIEEKIAEKCQEENRQKVMDNFSEMNGVDGNLLHQGVWKTKQKLFPKIKPTLPVAKKNLKGQLITNPEELKNLYLDTFKFRLRHRPVQPGFEEILETQEELFKQRLEKAKENKTPPWKMKDLEVVLKSLQTGKCRDPEGMIRDIFKEDVMGDDLKESLLMLLNKIKTTGTIPEFLNVVNISAIYKGKGEFTNLESERGIFIVNIVRYILMKMIYADKYDVIDKSMSDSNIGARKKKNIRNHIFVVNSVLHDVLSSSSKEPIDIMVLDFKQMFDSECLYECLNDVYEAGVVDDYFPLLYEANRETYVAVQTPNGLTKRETIKEIVMQGDVLAPLISSLQVDTMGKECVEEDKHLYYYKDLVPIPPLGLVDDLFTISTCGYKTKMLNNFINSKAAMKKLQFGTTKCVKLHVGKTMNKTLCGDLHVDGWKLSVETDSVTGKTYQKEVFTGQEKMAVKDEQLYLGDLVAANGRHDKNILRRQNRSIGIIDQIMDILNSTYFGRYYFEVALVLRSSLLLSSILLNSEAWVNLTQNNIRSLEKIDEKLLSRILDCEPKTSNAIKYLELGLYPIKFELMKKKIIFLQYILKQEKSSLIYQVLKATWENPIKNDFVKTCKEYLATLDITLSFQEIEQMSEWSFKKLVKSKTEAAGLKYLLSQKEKQTKVMDIEYCDLNIQEYFVGGNCKKKISQLIFKARSQTLDIKCQQKWKYADRTCFGCKIRDESGQEILTCGHLNYENSVADEQITYDWFYKSAVSDIVKVGQLLDRGLKKRQKFIETGIT